ncbi:MAG: hypothetical protein WAV27_00485 [Xanthobacteraceae bacterium]|jgi:hypothetical protein|nr:hypothetical protein [Tepidisphaeraceae bacterium]
MTRLTVVTDRRGKLIGAVQGHELSQQAGGVLAAVSFERGHKLYKVDADIDLADNIDPAELQKIFAKLLPKAAGRTKASARKKR